MNRHLIALRHSSSALLLPITVLLSLSCSATKTYVGPEQSPSEISRVYFFSAKGIDSSYLSIDGTTQGIFDIGLDILPGKHRADAEIKMKDQRCESYRGSYCSDIIASGACSANFSSEAGKQYAIRITGSTADAYISVEERDSKQIVGTGSCEVTDFDIAPHRP